MKPPMVTSFQIYIKILEGGGRNNWKEEEED